MDHHHFFLEVQPLAILLVVRKEYFLSSLGQVIAAAMQCIVKGLRNLEEVVAASDHIPVRLHFQF